MKPRKVNSVGVIVVRQARAQDVESVGRFLSGLSAASRYRRFFIGVPRMSRALIRNMATITPGRLVLLALDGDTVVGHVMATRVDEHTVDIGIVVADDYQYQGIGKRLLHELSGALAGLGVTKVRCDVLSQNYFVLKWLQRIPMDITFERSSETITVHGSVTAHEA